MNLDGISLDDLFDADSFVMISYLQHKKQLAPHQTLDDLPPDVWKGILYNLADAIKAATEWADSEDGKAFLAPY